METNILTEKALKSTLRAAADRDKAVTINDGGGLIAIARPDGAIWWRLRYTFAGRENRLSLGVYPAVSLCDARERRDESHRLLAAGIDPSENRKAEKAVQARKREAVTLADKGLPAVGSFEHVAREWLKTIHEAKVSAGHADRTRIRFGAVRVPLRRCPPDSRHRAARAAQGASPHRSPRHD